jgi:hypothetical protein
MIMHKPSEVRVTLSDELLEVLQAKARVLRVPLRWVIASLVCDTIETVDISERRSLAVAVSA